MASALWASSSELPFCPLSFCHPSVPSSCHPPSLLLCSCRLSCHPSCPPSSYLSSDLSLHLLCYRPSSLPPPSFYFPLPSCLLPSCLLPSCLHPLSSLPVFYVYLRRFELGLWRNNRINQRQITLRDRLLVLQEPQS